MRSDYNTERFQGFLRDLKESFWGDLQGKVRDTLKKWLEADSEQRREEYLGLRWYERAPEREDSRNGFYQRDYVTPWGVLRFRVRRTRKKAFLPRLLRAWERRSPEVAELIRQAVLRGIPTRGVGRVVALLTRRLTGERADGVQTGEGAGPASGGVSSGAMGRRVGVPAVGRGVDEGATRLGAREGFLQNLYARGLRGSRHELTLTDGCAGLGAALQTVYPRAKHPVRQPTDGVHKMRNICEAVRRRDHDRVKHDAQKSYQAPSLAQARRAFLKFQWNWQRLYPKVVKSLEKDLPQLLNFYALPEPLWNKLRTTYAIERCFVEIRRRTRPMVVFTNVRPPTDRIIYAIFSRFNQDWKNRTPQLFTQAA